MSLLELFCAVDDFYQHFQTTVGPKQLARGRGRKRGPAPTLAASEIITLIIPTKGDIRPLAKVEIQRQGRLCPIRSSKTCHQGRFIAKVGRQTGDFRGYAGGA